MTRIFLLAASLTLPFLVSGISLAKDTELSRHFSASSPEPGVELVHDDWSRILSAYIVEQNGVNLFSYAGVTAEDRARLGGYIDYLASQKVSSLTGAQQFAFWTNLYNAITVAVILDHYPIDSIRDISSGLLKRGPWKKKLVVVDDRELSLDDIEHEILRPIFKDNRVHYAVNCASIGCPNLQPVAYTGETLDSMLDHAAHQYINHERGARIEGGRLVVSSIYKWYTEDFGKDDRGVIDHLLTFADPDLAMQLETVSRISDYRYDWNLNEPR